MKKTLVITGILCIIIAIVLGVLWFTSTTPTNTTTTDSTTITPRTFAPFGFFADIFSGASSTHNSSGNGTTTSNTSSRSVYDLVGISGAYMPTDASVVAATFVQTGTSTGEVLRYVERETGHIYDLYTATGETRRISNTTIPRIQEAYFGDNGSLVALRYLGDDAETVETFVGFVGTSSEAISGEFIAQNTRAIALHPTSPEVFYTLDAGTGAAGRIYNAKTQQTRALFSSPLSEWHADWGAASYILLTTKPSSSAEGFAYILNPTTGATERILTGIFGLTTLPNADTVRILSGSSRSTTPSLFMYNKTTKAAPGMTGSTFPEKCAWISNSTRVVCAISSTESTVDDWYQGVISLNDSVWTLDPTTNLSDFIFDADTTQTPFDAIHLMASNDGQLLSFINKKDSHLWVASLIRTSVLNSDSEVENN